MNAAARTHGNGKREHAYFKLILTILPRLSSLYSFASQREFRFEFIKSYRMADDNLKLCRPEIVPELLQVTEHQLGAGGAGRVFKGHYSGFEVAVKELYATMMDETNLDELRREAATLANMRHPNVLQFFGVCFTGEKHLLVTEVRRMRGRGKNTER